MSKATYEIPLRYEDGVTILSVRRCLDIEMPEPAIIVQNCPGGGLGIARKYFILPMAEARKFAEEILALVADA